MQPGSQGIILYFLKSLVKITEHIIKGSVTICPDRMPLYMNRLNIKTFKAFNQAVSQNSSLTADRNPDLVIPPENVPGKDHVSLSKYYRYFLQIVISISKTQHRLM